jgi:hypothetical protein
MRRGRSRSCCKIVKENRRDRGRKRSFIEQIKRDDLL